MGKSKLPSVGSSFFFCPPTKAPIQFNSPSFSSPTSAVVSMAFSTPCPSGTRMSSSWTMTSTPFSMASFPLPLPIFKSSFKYPLLRYGYGSSLCSFAATLKSRNSSFSVFARATSEKSIHEFTVKDIDARDVSLSKFKGKVLLIVNVASKCGLTSSNYKELAHLYDKYKSQGFEILAFPCNQFGGQEPGTNQDIKNFACTRFKAEFPIFDKVDVNGPNTAPVYQFLKSNAGGFLGDVVKWNFEKFLVDKNGKVVERYPPTTSPFQIEKDIQKLLTA